MLWLLLLHRLLKLLADLLSTHDAVLLQKSLINRKWIKDGDKNAWTPIWPGGSS